MITDDQKEGEAVKLAGLKEHLALPTSLLSADYFLKDTCDFSQSFGESPV